MTLDLNLVSNGHVSRHEPEGSCVWGVRRDSGLEECGYEARLTVRRPSPAAFTSTWVYLCNRHGALVEDLLLVAFRAGQENPQRVPYGHQLATSTND